VYCKTWKHIWISKHFAIPSDELCGSPIAEDNCHCLTIRAFEHWRTVRCLDKYHSIMFGCVLCVHKFTDSFIITEFFFGRKFSYYSLFSMLFISSKDLKDYSLLGFNQFNDWITNPIISHIFLSIEIYFINISTSKFLIISVVWETII